ncbi:MAG TPA: hypothetical protein VGH74_13075 [Planctomycetaceae bacterium]|jgi:hypothetical protein
MFALTKEARMTQPSRNSQHRNRISFPLDLCGPYAADEFEERTMGCVLQIDRMDLPVEIPVGMLRKLRRLGDNSEVVLRIPGETAVAVDVLPALTEKQQKSAAGWSAEMGDFDRF